MHSFTYTVPAQRGSAAHVPQHVAVSTQGIKVATRHIGTRLWASGAVHCIATGDSPSLVLGSNTLAGDMDDIGVQVLANVNAALYEGRGRRVVDSAGFFRRETDWDTTPAWNCLVGALMTIPSGSS